MILRVESEILKRIRDERSHIVRMLATTCKTKTKATTHELEPGTRYCNNASLQATRRRVVS